MLSLCLVLLGKMYRIAPPTRAFQTLGKHSTRSALISFETGSIQWVKERWYATLKSRCSISQGLYSSSRCLMATK
jgi:hypothetical protein